MSRHGGREARVVFGFHAVLARLADAQRARLLLGAATHDVPVDELLSRWDGSFVLLWRSAVPPQARNLSLGMWSDAVRDLLGI